MTPERTTAEAQLERILYILPSAARDGGRTIDELAQALDVTPQQVVKDLTEATGRSYHHPGGGVEPYAILFSRRRVRVLVDNEFQRPARLNAREVLALALGLRALAADVDNARRTQILHFARRLEAALAAPDVTAPHDGSRGRARPHVQEDGVEYDVHDLTLALGDDAYRGTFADAVQQRVVCTMSYLKPHSDTPETRHIAAYRLVHAEGRWYVAGYDLDRHGLRFFRLDRVLGAVLGDAPAPPPPDGFDEWIAAAPFQAADELQVTIRYDRAVAPWLLERMPCEVGDDGSVVVRHRVADASWLARHVLRFGGAAVVQEPREAVQWVLDAAERLAG